MDQLYVIKDGEEEHSAVYDLSFKPDEARKYGLNEAILLAWFRKFTPHWGDIDGWLDIPRSHLKYEVRAFSEFQLRIALNSLKKQGLLEMEVRQFYAKRNNTKIPLRDRTLSYKLTEKANAMV